MSHRFIRVAQPHPPQHEGRLGRAIARAKEGDMSAFHYLYVRYADDVYGYVNSIVRDHHEAEDITQNLFAKLMRIIGKYEQRDVPFGAWILRVARNATLDHMRARRQIPFEEVRTNDEGNEQVGFEREVLVLRHIAGLTPPEIADLLDKTESSIHGLHHRGRGALQAALRELDAAPVTAVA
jgi:RNA polymerase sigma-70 factor (ECF subfamily)